MNQQQYDQIKLAAYNDELDKIAGVVSEGVSTALDFPLTAIPVGIGYLKGPRSEEDMAKAEKHGVSNILIPFVGPYRLGRRIATQQENPKMYKKLMEKMEKEKSKK